MKLQYLSVVFIMIFLPIVLVTTFYIQQQMETITNQLDYDTALLDATHDAMVAFEINTANEDLSSVSDSLRSIIDASNNILLNTLAINFGVSNASKAFVQPYIPAVLYSLYDGYYIYSPTNTPIVCTDQFGQTISTDSYGVSYDGYRTYTSAGQTIKYGVYKFDESSLTYPSGDSVTPNGGNLVNFNSLKNDGIESEYGQMLYENEDGTYSTVIHTNKSAGATNNTKYKIDYILKSYIPYAATYSNSDLNITINYTLDNYITIMGDIGDIYYSKSGYLIDNNLINNIKVNGNTIDWFTYSDEELENMSKNPNDYEIIVTFNPDDAGNVVVLSNRENSQGTEYWDDAQDSVSYYSRAWAFSQWIYNTTALTNLKESDIVTSVYELVNENIMVSYKNVEGVSENLLYDFTSSNNKIFYKNNLSNADSNYELEAKKANPENNESNFVEHKRHTIRNSITYNLCLAMTAYNDKNSAMKFQMPVLRDEEWDKILSNVSILTFMQGLNCGHKIYNNYALVCSNNNEISVTPGELYYTKYTTSLTDGDQDYTGDGVVDGTIETVHRINCPKLEDSNYYTSLKSKDIKYDKNYNSITGQYDYDHKAYTCYTCLVNANYEGISGKKNGADTLEESVESNAYKLKAYYIAIGKERENLYKPTAVAESTAVEIINFNTPIAGVYNVDGTKTLTLPSKSKYGINRISKIDVTLDGTCVDSGVKNLYTTSLVISLNGNSSMQYGQVIIPVTSTVTRTIQLSGSFSNTAELESLKFSLGNEAVNFNVRSIKIYYK